MNLRGDVGVFAELGRVFSLARNAGLAAASDTLSSFLVIIPLVHNVEALVVVDKYFKLRPIVATI